MEKVIIWSIKLILAGPIAPKVGFWKEEGENEAEIMSEVCLGATARAWFAFNIKYNFHTPPQVKGN